MRIALVHEPGRERGGAERYLDVLEHGLGARSHEVRRWTPRASPGERGAGSSLATRIAAGADVVHVHHLADAELLESLASAAPVVCSVHDHRAACPASNRLGRDGSACTREAGWWCAAHGVLGYCSGLPRWPLGSLRRVSVWSRWARALAPSWPVIVASSYMRDVVVGQGWPEHGVRVLPYPVAVTEPAPKPASSARELLFAGRLVEPDKGLALLVEVLRRLPPTTRSVIAGDGPSRPWLERRLRDLGLGERVAVVGWLDRESLSRRMADAALLVMPSAWPEPSGLVGVEALAHGRPVVATDVGGVAEWLREGEVGHRVPTADPAIMADRIRDLLRDGARRDAMGEAGREWVRRHRSLAAHLDAIESLYASAARPAAGRARA